jgi:hypothetical protein
VSGPLHTVHVRVNDAATGQPTPVRIQFAGPEKHSVFAPLGRVGRLDPCELTEGEIVLIGGHYACIDGTCEVQLPADPVRVEICKGFEYTPSRQEVSVGPGKMALRFSLERWIDLRRERWYSGDTSAHLLSPHAALLEGAAEDLAVVNLLALEWPPLKPAPFRSIPNITAFSGQRPALEMPGHMVVVNTTNCGGILGTLDLLNCHRVVHPLTTGLEKEAVFDIGVSGCHGMNGTGC